MQTYAGSDRGPVLVLAHGAGAGSAHPWMVSTGRELARRGVTVVTFDFPYMAAKRRVPDRGPVLEAAFRDVWDEVARLHPGRPLLAGGKSMGGRIASQAAAAGAFTPAPAGLIFFGYPLHPPGKPEARRDAHLPRVACPMLFLHGTRDPFGSPDEMLALAAGHDTWEVELIDGGDHSLTRPKRQDPEGAALRQAWDSAGRWALARASAGR